MSKRTPSQIFQNIYFDPWVMKTPTESSVRTNYTVQDPLSSNTASAGKRQRTWPSRQSGESSHGTLTLLTGKTCL